MHIERLGTGPDLVMVHGWSMHSGVWRELAEQLAQSFTVHLVDLPGHGRSAWQQDALNLDHLLPTFAQQLPDNAMWIGWSLGGLVSLMLAEKYPTKIAKLVLLAATPLFVEREDWPCAMDAAIFEQFADNLDMDQTQTIKRFLMLQARGSEQSRETIRTISERLATEHTPHSQALKAGLSLLLEQDARRSLASINCPVLLLMGDKDSLIPSTLYEQARQLNNTLQLSVIVGAGHAPFISHPELCRQQLEQFLND